MAFLALLSIVQSTIVWVGLAAGMVLCVLGVAQGKLTVGDTVLFVTMMTQLYLPLTYFSSYYRQVSRRCRLTRLQLPTCHCLSTGASMYLHERASVHCRCCHAGLAGPYGCNFLHKARGSMLHCQHIVLYQRFSSTATPTL